MAMNSPKIVIYCHPNPEMKSFHVNEEISSHRVEHFQQPLNSDSEDTLSSLGNIGARVVKEMMAVPGIKKLSIKPKEVLIKKEEAFLWEDIEQKIIEIIQRAIRIKGIKVVKR